MTLPDVSFTNNVGTITFKRCLVDVADEWQWDGRAVQHRKRIGLQGMLLRDSTERIDGILTQPASDTKSLGLRGDLTLPWTTLHEIRIDSLEMPTGGWQVMAPVTASFVDDLQHNNVYQFTFFGLPLLSPRIRIPIPAKSTSDYYAQMPMVQVGDIDVSNPFYGPIRYRIGYQTMRINVMGSIALDTGLLPTDIVEILQQRTGVTPGANSLAEMPEGYPVVFKLGDAIPEVKGDLAISSVWVSGAQISWKVEEQMANVTIQMITQPQAWAES